MANRSLIQAERVVRLAPTAVFAWAGGVKILHPSAFLQDLETYQLFPAVAALLIASYLPWLEVMAAVGLWIPALRRGAALLLLGLTVGFLIVIGVSWARGLDLSCGCLGASSVTTAAGYAQLVARDVAILVALSFLVWAGRQSRMAFEATRRPA